VSDHPDECDCADCLRAESYMLGEDLDALQRLADAATPGPWEASRGNCISGPGYAEVLKPGQVRCMAYCYGGESTIDGDNLTNDVAFTLAAREAVPALIERVRELEGRLADSISFENPVDCCDQARAVERAAIVAWLRRSYPLDLEGQHAADAIEAGEHLKEQG